MLTLCPVDGMRKTLNKRFLSDNKLLGTNFKCTQENNTPSIK
jgi:hypothetical protein